MLRIDSWSARQLAAPDVRRAPQTAIDTRAAVPVNSRFESMSFVVNILACKLKIVNNRN